MKNRIRSEGSYFQILCAVEEGSEPLFFEWFRNGQSIKSGPDVKYRIENSEMSSTFSIKSVERHDAGNYSCLVKNAVGTDSQNMLLNVKGNPNLHCYQILEYWNRWYFRCILSERITPWKILDELG